MAIQITPGPTVGESTPVRDPQTDDPRGYLDRATKDGRPGLAPILLHMG
ncbi:hypothetical protein [Streptomyces sp. NPDC015345]